MFKQMKQWWLIWKLHSKYTDVREEAAKELGQIGNAHTIGPLVTALQVALQRDYDGYFLDLSAGGAAAEALQEIGNADTLKPYLDSLVTSFKYWGGDSVSGRIADLLVIIGPAAIKPLVTTVQDRERATETSWYRDRYTPQKTLVTALYSGEAVTGMAAMALQKILETSATRVAPEDLRRVADLPVEVRYFHSASCGEEASVADFGHARQLARQELIRRGLGA